MLECEEGYPKMNTPQDILILVMYLAPYFTDWWYIFLRPVAT